MGADPLDEACTLAFDVARQGVEANPPVDPPAPMRNFLYVAHLPRRAMSVAHRVIDDDPDFRERVAAEATLARVGQAGILWLQRPDGWEETFGALIGGAAHDTTPPPPPPVPASERPAPTVETQRPAQPPAPDLDSSHEDIETELASLRDLVDRLADERQHVGASMGMVEEAGDGLSPTPTDSDMVSVTELRRVGDERDAAESARQEAVEQQATMEAERHRLRAELSEAQEKLSGFETELATVQSDLSSAREAVSLLESRISELEDEAHQSRTQIDAISDERDDVAKALADLGDERDDLAGRLATAEQARTDVDLEVESLTAEALERETELRSLRDRRAELEAEVDELTRLREGSESARRQMIEDLGQQLGRVEAERDLLASKLELAHTRLGGTRTALDSATTSIGTELDGADEALNETSRAAADLERVVNDATERLNEVEAEMSPDVFHPVEPPVDPGTPIEIPAEDHEAAPPEVAEDDVAWNSELDGALAAYGLGAETTNGDDDSETAPTEMVENGAERSPLDVSAAVEKPAPAETTLPATTPAPTESAAAQTEESGPEPEVAETPGLPSNSRRQIPPITGDPVEVARHVVSTPDVVVLLDGDPIASLGWPTLGVAERRDALVSYLGDLAAETGAASDVVFDGRVGDEANLPVSRAVRVRLTNIEVEPTIAIGELVEAYPLQWPVAIVTDDADLGARATEKGATLLDNGQLLDLFIAS